MFEALTDSALLSQLYSVSFLRAGFMTLVQVSQEDNNAEDKRDLEEEGFKRRGDTS